MSEFSNIMKVLGQAAEWNKNMGAAGQFSELAKTQKKMLAVDSISWMIKDWQKQQIYNRAHLTGFDSIANALAPAYNYEKIFGIGIIGAMLKGIQKQDAYNHAHFNEVSAAYAASRMQIPQTVLEVISSIGFQQQKLFNNFFTSATVIKNSAALANMGSLHWTLTGLSGKMASIAAKNNQWHLLDDFAEINDGAAIISERIAEQEYATKQDVEELKQLFEIVLNRLSEIEAVVKSKFSHAIAIIGLILALIAEVRVHIPKPEAATKSDIEALRHELLYSFKTKLTEVGEYRFLNRACRVLLKPKSKSYIVTELPANYNVIVLQTKHQWAFISYSNPKDGMTQTGWVLKKYLGSRK